MNSLGRDLAQNIIAVAGLSDAAATAGGAGDNADANGITIDQLAYERSESMTFIAAATAVLGASATLALRLRVQDSADGSSWADVTDPRLNGVAEVSVTSAAGAGTRNTAATISVPTEYLRRYVRMVATPNLSAANTDTARVQGIVILSGLARRP